MTDTPDIRIVELMEEGMTDMPTSPQPPGLTDEECRKFWGKYERSGTYWKRDMTCAIFAAGCAAQRKMDEAESDELAAKCVELEQQVHDAYLLGKDEQRRVDAALVRGAREKRSTVQVFDVLADLIERTPEQPTTHADCTIANPCAECRKFMGKQPTTQRCGTCGSDNPSEQITDVLKHRTDWVCDDKFHSQPTTGEASGE